MLMGNCPKCGVDISHAFATQPGERTYREWSLGHPLRKLPVVAEEDIKKLETRPNTALVCSLAGETRLAPAAGDADVDGICCQCRRPVVHRRSAPKLPLWCWRCFAAWENA